MPIYYSNSTKGFYDSEIHKDKIPEDKVEIAAELREKLLEGQVNGKLIDLSPSGQPVLVDPTGLTEEELNEAHNADIIEQIQHLETTLQPRAIRDMLLFEDAARLLDLEDQIQELRAQFK